MKGFEFIHKLAATASASSSTSFNPLAFLPGFLTLTPFSTTAERTALRGVSPLDALILAPGVHLQASANELNKGEYPACAALTSGYVFRVENPATVYFLQRVGRTGCLTTLRVADASSTSILDNAASSLGYYTAFGCSLFAAQRLYALDDVWGLLFMSNLVIARIINYAILRRRSQPGWFGAPEPGVQGDLFILLSQDRWVRIQGSVDDLKTLTSGAWLDEPTTMESFFGAVAKMISYANVAIAGHATDAGAFTLAAMLAINSGLLAFDNLRVRKLRMYSKTMEPVGEPKKYFRRRDLADQLIKESGRDDWAVSMGMIVKPKESSSKDPRPVVAM